MGGRAMSRHLRGVTKDARWEIKKRVITGIRENGLSAGGMCRFFGLSRSTVHGWLKAFDTGGWEAVQPKTQPGRPPKMTPEQQEIVLEVIRTKRPDECGFEPMLWTRPIVSAFIQREFGITLHPTTVGRFLRRHDLTPQRPVRKARKQNPEKVKRWLEVEFPKIQKEARIKGAEVLFGDEACVRTDHHAASTWAPRGHTPVVQSIGYAARINAVSFISSQGSLRFSLFEGGMNGQRLIKVLRQFFMKSGDRPVILILDNAQYHKSKLVQSYVESTGGRVKIYFLPPYSPELNPDEFVWNHLKCSGIDRREVFSKDDLRRKAFRHLRRLQQDTEKVSHFFNGKYTGYAA